MDRIRTVDIEIDAPRYPAVERTMIDGIAAGTTEPTIMSWTFDEDLFLAIGPIQDAGLIDTERAVELGVPYVRRYNIAGSVGIFRTDHTPTLYAVFPDDGERTLDEVIALAGEAMVDALTAAGLDGVYYDGGDIELDTGEDGVRATKVGVAGACGGDGAWGVFVNVINRNYDPADFEVVDDVVGLPKVKFEDKDTDSVAGRMGALEDVAPDVDVQDVLEVATENIAERLELEPTAGALTDGERETIVEHEAFYGSDEWFDSVSTANLLESADADHRIAEVAFKARKLVKASVVVDANDTIVNALYTGDMYHKPRSEALERLSGAIVGHDVTDEADLLSTLRSVFQDEDFEVPWMDPEDFLEPLKRVPDNLTPVREFGRE